jgi:hypothetical protein
MADGVNGIGPRIKVARTRRQYDGQEYVDAAQPH